MTKLKNTLKILLVTSSMASFANASAGVSGGLSLLTEGNARAASMGQAYTAAFDDVAGMAYNPSSLMTLKSGQASLLYQKGLIEDTYGQLMVGSPRSKNSALGFGIGYYNGGKIDLTNANGTTNSVTSQQDFSLSLGYARNFVGSQVGFNVKYLQSTLIEEATARAYAFDLGFQMPVTSRLRIGAAALNYGTKLTYLSQGDTLPRTLRAGAAYLLLPGNMSTSLLVDAPYMVNEKILTPSVGLETLIGPLAIRAGFRTGGGTREFTMGAGFTMGRSSIDYAFGLMNQLNAQHRLSLGMHFGGAATPAEFVKRPMIERNVKTVSTPAKPLSDKSKTTAKIDSDEKRHKLGNGEQIIRMPVHQTQRRVYVVKHGDTLATIAQKEMGDKRKWQAIYTANKHLLDDPGKLQEGERIIIP